jgi:tripartite-type tricarboxylate transporter receptor subunit TctC
LSACSGLIASLVLSATAFAQAFPAKPVMIMVPYPAGGLSDNIARRVNVPLGTALGQPVIVDNLGGASGAIAAQKVLNSPSDGYYVFQGSPNELILAPLAMSAAKNADELVAYAAKAAKDGKPLTYASVGVGSFYHLLGAKLSKDLGVPMTHVPYKGGADAMRDLFTDSVDIFITPYGLAQVELAKQGKIKFIAVLTPERQRLVPDVPSTKESKALKSFTAEIGTGYFVKRDTPEPVVQVLHKALQKTLGDTQLRAGLFAMGQESSPLQSLADADKSYNLEIVTYQGIAKAIGLQPQ